MAPCRPLLLSALLLILLASTAADNSEIFIFSKCNHKSGPVCTEGSRIFASECAAEAAAARILHYGECNRESDPLRCPVKCLCPKPVCGEDFVTYWCGPPAARCAGVSVAHDGLCPQGNTGLGMTPRAWESLLLVHLVWLGLALGMVLAGVL